MEVIGSDGEVPQTDDAVLDIVCGGTGVGRDAGRGSDCPPLLCAKHGHHLHYAADVDGETRHAAGHLVAVGKSGADEEGGEDTVEFILLSVREAQGEAEAILTVQKANADALKMLNEASPTDRIIQLKSLEAFGKAADGKATKIIIPSDIQGLAGNVTAIKELWKDDVPKA